MRPLAPLLVLLAACGARSEPPAAAPPAPRAFDPDRAWRELAPRGRDWQQKLASIPPEHREAMAIAFLHQGNVHCPSVEIIEGCNTPVVRMLSVFPSDDLDVPCLRRAIAVWAVEQVDPIVFTEELRRRAIEMASLGPVERRLNRAVFAKLRSVADEALMVQAIRGIALATDDELGGDAVDGLSVESLNELACAGVDAALRELVEREANVFDFLEGCRDSPSFRRDTIIATAPILSRDYSDSSRRRSQNDFLATFVATDCTIAHAMDEVATGELEQWIAGKRDHGSWQFTTCMAILDEDDAAISDRVAEKLTIHVDTDHPNDDTRDRMYSDRVDNDLDFTLPWVDELARALPGCDGTVCSVPGTAITFQLAFDARGRLSEITRTETIEVCQ